MVRGLYQSSGAMQYLMDKTDVVGNNIANSSTNGFKRKGVFIRELVGAEQALERDQIHARVHDGRHFTMQRSSGCQPSGSPYDPEGEIATYTDYTAGALRETGNPLDLALNGPGYFVVQTAQGNAYTRDGQFKLDSNGRLVTANGDPVVGEGGPIQISEGNVAIGNDGSITVNGNVVNRIAVRSFDESKLVRIREGLYVLPEGNAASESRAGVQQGYLETSNVNIVKEMVEMIATQRHYDSSARVLQTIDSSLQKSVNDIGRL